MKTINGTEVKMQFHDLWIKIQKTGFWWLIIFMLGAILGVKGAKYNYTTQFDDAVKLGGMIHRSIVYDIKLRP